MRKNSIKTNKNFNYIELFFVLGFMILVGIVVYFLINGIIYETKEVKYEGYYSNNQINAIMLATDNAINKIYNILVVSTIFFTILVASITIFQYIKIRDIDKLKEELKNELYTERELLDEKLEKSQEWIETFEREYNLRFSKIEENYQKQLSTVDYMILNLQEKIDNLSRKSAELQIDTNYVKAKEFEKRKEIPNSELINTYEEIKKLVESYPNTKSNEFISKLYIDLVASYLSLGDMSNNYNYLKSMLNKAIELSSNPITESCAYKVFVDLEDVYRKDADDKIKYLEKIHEENPYDYEYTLKLADACDMRNKYDDLNRAIYYVEDSINYRENVAKDYCKELIQDGYLRNSIKSSVHKERIEKILGISL